LLAPLLLQNIFLNVGQSLQQGVSGVALQEQMLRMFMLHSLEIGSKSCFLKSRSFRKISAVL